MPRWPGIVLAVLLPASGLACPLSHDSASAASALQAVLGAAGLTQTNFEIRESDHVLNARALICDGNRYVLANSQFLSGLGWTDGNWNWTKVGILAREIGRHVMGHVVYRGERHREEISADRYAGHLLFRMGASLDQALAMTERLPEVLSSSHPRKSERAAAVRVGWGDASDAADSGRAVSGSGPPPVPAVMLRRGPGPCRRRHPRPRR